MGLQKAMDAHAKGDLVAAEHEYKRALKQSIDKPALYQNYGALLRATDRFDEAESIYLQGISLYKDHYSINLNLANLYRDNLEKPVTALKFYIDAFINSSSGGQISNSSSSEPYTALQSIVVTLRDLECYAWALRLIKDALKFRTSEPGLLVNLILLLDRDLGPLVDDNADFFSTTKKMILAEVRRVPLKQQIDIYFSLANYEISQDNGTLALSYFQKALAVSDSMDKNDIDDLEKLRTNMHINAWNMGCLLLKLQNFSDGWKLFENGLLTPAAGRQRWQRSLAKPFNNQDVPLWRGESLHNKRLLLLEEQAIGDAMMFITLLPTIASEAQHVGILLSDRLTAIYKQTFASMEAFRNCTVHSHTEFSSGSLSSSDFDFQLPIGSICQHRFVDMSSYSPLIPCIQHRSEITSSLRDQYLKGASPTTKLIGISWRGGAKPDRIKKKSVDEADFFSIISDIPNVRFVNIQYGPVEQTLKQWSQQGLPVVYDKRINPLKNMHSWIDQVAACDAVISVANTTIHGAGGLGIPTMCLLSRAADWRWFSDDSVTRSYWYPTVGIARESKTHGWNLAFSKVRQWIKDGCPKPQGPVFS